MKTRIVKQFICDFCGKKKYSISAMNKHEKHCTMNPNRECRMCILNTGAPQNLEELKKILPDPIKIDSDGDGIKITNRKEILEAMPKLIEAAEKCPACILSTIRQKGIFLNLTGYNYTEEMKKFWIDYNEEHSKGDYTIYD